MKTIEVKSLAELEGEKGKWGITEKDTIVSVRETGKGHEHTYYPKDDRQYLHYRRLLSEVNKK